MPIEIASAKAGPARDSNPGDPAYLKVRDLVYRSSGIYHAEEKLYLLVSRCARRMTALGVTRPADYLEHLTVRPNCNAEMRLLLNEITIGETYMFRHPTQLEALRNLILPQILQVKGLISLKRLRFWCAGCSTGEEPLTLAMFLLEPQNRARPGIRTAVDHAREPQHPRRLQKVEEQRIHGRGPDSIPGRRALPGPDAGFSEADRKPSRWPPRRAPVHPPPRRAGA